jgi:type IV pilus assembly protein PilM
MALPFFSAKGRPIDLVINDHSIRYLELKNSGLPVPLKWGERYLPPGIIKEGKIIDLDTLEVILEQCIQTWKFRNRKVRFLVPDPFVTIRKIPIPADLVENEIKDYLYLEMGASIHLPFEDPVFDFITLPVLEDKQEILLFAANRERVLEYSHLLSRLKLKPEVADLSALALYRLYHLFSKRTGVERMLMIQFDIDIINMSIFENEVPFFMRHYSIHYDEKEWEIQIGRSGFQQLTFIGDEDQLQQQLNDAYREMNKLIEFYQFSLHQGKNEINKMVLTGDHPLLSKIVADLSNRFEIEIQLLDASELDTEKNKPLPRSHNLVLGLALKEV